MRKRSLFSFVIALVATVTYAQTPALTDGEAVERKNVPTTEVNGLWWLFNEADRTATLAYKCNRRDVMDTEWLSDPGIYSGDIVIPETVNGYTVTSIYEFAFSECADLTSVTLPSTIKTIGAYAFFDSSLPKITIPASVTTIGEDAFNCPNLKKVVIEDGNSILKMYSHQNGTANYKGTFGWGQFAVGAQPIEEAYIGRVIETVDDNALFYGSSVKKVTFGNVVKEIPENWFNGCEQLESVTLSSATVSIGNNAFDGCKKLPTLELPEGLTTIGNGAFNNCEAMTEIHLPSTLKTIGEWAFSGTGLSEIIIPNNIQTIGDYALSIASLKKVVIEDGETTLTIGNNGYGSMFSASASEMGMKLEEAYVGRNIESSLFSGNTTLKKITFGDKVTSIYTNFCEGTPLETLIIGKGVRSIGESAFSAFWEESAKLSVIYSYATTPPTCADDNVFNNINKQTCKLYVPIGTVDAYKNANTWKDFFSIEEMAETKCAAPTITLENGKLKFTSTTAGVEFHYQVTLSGSKEGTGSEVEVPAKYVVSVYATKAGLEDSEVSTAELTGNAGGTVSAGDANNDGVINAADIVAIVNIIMGK